MSKIGKLSIVATPIGNLEDITLRALRVLKECDLILCENVSNTQKLLKHYNIHTKTSLFYSHSTSKHFENIFNLLNQGKHLVLVSDAGTPTISDPGALLINKIRESLSEVIIETIPGPSALISAISLSGLLGNQFVFLGFVPQKKGRETFIKNLNNFLIPKVMYESVHRILKLLESLEKYFPDKQIIICREITKIHEEFLKDRASNLLKYFKENKDHLKGEFVVIVL